jgi:hypothetical protein
MSRLFLDTLYTIPRILDGIHIFKNRKREKWTMMFSSNNNISAHHGKNTLMVNFTNDLMGNFLIIQKAVI